MSTTPGFDAVAAAAERLLPGGQIEPVEGRWWLVKVTTDSGRFSVRQVDPSLPSVRVDLIHEFLAQPELKNTTPLIARDRVGLLAFDARVWVDGTVTGSAVVRGAWNTLHLPSDLTIDQLGAVGSALGRFHRTGMNGSIVARAPNYKPKEVLAAVRRSIDLAERRLALEIRKESRARRWLGAARPLLSNAEKTLELTGFLRDEPPVLAHLDLSGSHIVDGPGSSVCFLDCSTLGAAPAAVDLAQLVARSGPWSEDRVERLLQRYADEMPLPPIQRRLIPWLVALDAIPTCGQLLVRAIDDREPLSEVERRAVLAAIDRQIDLLTALAAAFIPSPSRRRRPGRRHPRPAE
jgi:Ser/Thr protein kinase RdoA (MazF antagonist)